jgi:GNAT superfamily N-acetyltransferase
LNTRPAHSEDLELAFQIKKAAFAAYVEQLWGWNDTEQRTLHACRFNTQDALIIQLNGHDIGLMTTTRSADAIHLHQLFLLPTQHSKGIGTACMSSLLAEAGRAALPIRLQVLKNNPRAARFYLRLGFSQVAETETHVQMEKAP